MPVHIIVKIIHVTYHVALMPCQVHCDAMSCPLYGYLRELPGASVVFMVNCIPLVPAVKIQDLSPKISRLVKVNITSPQCSSPARAPDRSQMRL